MMIDRVGERPVSPSTTNRSSTNSSSSCHSRDYSKPRRSYYRLFPSVEPTPPASPISLHHQQRISLRTSSASGPGRRRSSSEDNGRGARDSQLPPPVLASLSTTPIKEGRKGSIPELSLLQTVQENGRSDVAPEVRSGVKPSAVQVVEGSHAVQAQDDNVFDSVLPEGTTKASDTSSEILAVRGYDGQVRLRGTTTALSIGLGLDIPTVQTPDDDLTLSERHIYARTKPRPNLRIEIVKETGEEKPLPPSKSLQHSREGSTESVSDGSMHSTYLAQDRPAARGVRVASVALKQSIVPLNGELKIRELTVAPHAGRPRVSQQIPPHETVDTSHRPASPPAPQKNSVGRWAELPSLASRFNSRAATPEPYVRLPPDHYARPATSQGQLTSSAASFSTVDYSENTRAATPDLTARSALAAARANVAALSQVDVPMWNPSFAEQSKTPASDLGSLHSRPSHAGIADPIQTLAELSEQVEALHARYASLRAQRQQLSSGIIANLKEQKSGAEFGDALLNEQLSLAAVSSSIDICFAKLNSLECLREDAIATLVAQAGAARRAPDEAATASRKSSLAPSLDSGSRIATGRSTPDLHALYRSNRPGPIKVHSYRSEHEGQRTRSPLYSQRSPLIDETNTMIEHHSDNLAFRHPKRLIQIREPSGTSESSCDTAVGSSTTGEMDDNQTSDPSDTEDMLTEELMFRKPQRTDGSLKAVQVLGIELDDTPVSPSHIRAGTMKKKARVPPKLNLRLDADLDDMAPLTASTVNIDDPDQLARDLERQLQSFPSAPAPVSSRTSTRRERRHDSPVQRSDTGKSNASAYTINVYFDGSHEDLPPLP